LGFKSLQRCVSLSRRRLGRRSNQRPWLDQDLGRCKPSDWSEGREGWGAQQQHMRARMRTSWGYKYLSPNPHFSLTFLSLHPNFLSLFSKVPTGFWSSSPVTLSSPTRRLADQGGGATAPERKKSLFLKKFRLSHSLFHPLFDSTLKIPNKSLSRPRSKIEIRKEKWAILLLLIQVLDLLRSFVTRPICPFGFVTSDSGSASLLLCLVRM